MPFTSVTRTSTRTWWTRSRWGNNFVLSSTFGVIASFTIFDIQQCITKQNNLYVILQYDADSRMIVVDVKKPKGDRKSDLTHMAYYMEKDVCWSIEVFLQCTEDILVFCKLSLSFLILSSFRWRFYPCSGTRRHLSPPWEASSWRWRTSWCTMWMRSPQLSPCSTWLAGSLLSLLWWCWLWSLACWLWWVCTYLSVIISLV